MCFSILVFLLITLPPLEMTHFFISYLLKSNSFFMSPLRFHLVWKASLVYLSLTRTCHFSVLSCGLWFIISAYMSCFVSFLNFKLFESTNLVYSKIFIIFTASRIVVVYSLSHVRLFCNSMNCISQASLSMEFFQVRILERVAVSYSRGSSWPRDQTCVFCIGWWILYCWANIL